MSGLLVDEVVGIYEFARWSHRQTSFTVLDGMLGIHYWNTAVEAKIDALATANALQSRAGALLRPHHRARQQHRMD